MARIRRIGIFGTVANNPLASGGTTLQATALADLPAVTAPDIAVIILDPAGEAGDAEIVYVTAHTAASTSATISRGEEQSESGGSAPREHAQGTTWMHAASPLDYGPPTPHVEVFDSSGTFDATQVPVGPDGKQWVEVEALGGGESGAGNTSSGQFGGEPGGRAGTYVSGVVDITGETSITVTVGDGGAGGTGGFNAGGDSSFGSFVVAPGGGSGTSQSGGDFAVPDSNNAPGFRARNDDDDGNMGVSGAGGSSFYGHGGTPQYNADEAIGIDGEDATGYGAGGSGSVGGGGSNDHDGGDGASGIVIVRWVA